MDTQFDKQIAIFNTVVNAAVSTVALCKQLPKSGKRNPFIKSYNRRPRNKQKRALVMAQMAINARIAHIQLQIIASQPLPKYPIGGNSGVVKEF